MINLVPTYVRTERDFAIRNASMVRYVIFAACLAVCVIAILLIGNLYTQRLISQAENNIAAFTAQSSTLSDIETSAERIERKLQVIEQLFDDQTKFSTLLSDIAQAMPSNSTLTNISLTGEDDAPLTINAQVPTLGDAAILRNALVQSERFSEVDIQTTVFNEDANAVDVVLVAGFTQGSAR